MGDIVDYLDLKNELYCWTRATIKHREGNNIELELPFQSNLEEDKENSSLTTQKCLINSNVIAPLKTFCLDFEWRENLKAGDEADMYDNKEWYLVTVLANEPKEQIIIGFRLYDETGDLEDLKYLKNKKYFQWIGKLEEEIKYSCYDTRLRK